jgi:8-oxo-dGTP pyrophosphatase MutT (NUDIX family)
MSAATDAGVSSSPRPTGPGGAPQGKRHAAAAILLRESVHGLEVLLVRRLQSMAMAGGDWVFPGGALASVDHSPQALQCCAPLAAAQEARLRTESDAPVALPQLGPASCIAACREVFEETGILLAREHSGAPCHPQLVEALQPNRAQVAADPEGFIRMLAAHHLLLELDRLVYWERWITPSAVPRRFDTRFFLAPMPAAQQAQQELQEADSSRWLSLREEDGHSRLEPPITTPPTLFPLQELAALHARHGSLQDLLAACASLRPPTVMMKIVREETGLVALAPWDVDYPDSPGEGVPCDVELRARFATYPSRIIVPIDRGPVARI